MSLQEGRVKIRTSWENTHDRGGRSGSDTGTSQGMQKIVGIGRKNFPLSFKFILDGLRIKM